MRSPGGTIHYTTAVDGDSERDDASFEVANGVLFIIDNEVTAPVKAFAPGYWMSAWWEG